MFIMFTVFTMSMSNFLRAMAEILLCIIHSMDQLVPTDQAGTGHVDQVQDEAHMARRQFFSKKSKKSVLETSTKTMMRLMIKKGKRSPQRERR